MKLFIREAWKHAPWHRKDRARETPAVRVIRETPRMGNMRDPLNRAFIPGHQNIKSPEVDMTTKHDLLVKCSRAQLKKGEGEFRWVTTAQSKPQTRDRREDAPDQVE